MAPASRAQSWKDPPPSDIMSGVGHLLFIKPATWNEGGPQARRHDGCSGSITCLSPSRSDKCHRQRRRSVPHYFFLNRKSFSHNAEEGRTRSEDPERPWKPRRFWPSKLRQGTRQKTLMVILTLEMIRTEFKRHLHTREQRE